MAVKNALETLQAPTREAFERLFKDKFSCPDDGGWHYQILDHVYSITGGVRPIRPLFTTQDTSFYAAQVQNGSFVEARFITDGAGVCNLVGISLRNSGPKQAQTSTLNSEATVTLLKGLKDIVIRQYIDQSASKKYAAWVDALDPRVIAKLDGGIASYLSWGLSQVARDKHLYVHAPEELDYQVTRYGDRQPSHTVNGANNQICDPGFEARILEGNIGLMTMTAFSDPPCLAKELELAMSKLSTTRALIIDVRLGSGGDGSVVDQIVNYMYDKPTHLTSSVRRGEGGTDIITKNVTKPKALSETIALIPLYVLSSSRTFSAGEA
ncbi:MAG: hypothetical protein JKY60_12605, partial [Kordiimonadaceae bacterium]|nr:hypothetical protein [Kordiimonadaceae bacterium]